MHVRIKVIKDKNYDRKLVTVQVTSDFFVFYDKSKYIKMSDTLWKRSEKNTDNFRLCIGDYSSTNVLEGRITIKYPNRPIDFYIDNDSKILDNLREIFKYMVKYMEENDYVDKAY